MLGFRRKAGVEGHVDGAVGGVVRGWAWRPARPDPAVEVEIWCGETLVGRASADRYRADLAEAGKRGGACGFELHLGDAHGEMSVRASAEDGGAEFGRIQVAQAPRRMSVSAPITAADWLGSVDRLGPMRINGWARSELNASAKPQLELWADGERVLSFTAQTWRRDLEELGQGDGRWGFDEPLPYALRDGEPHRVDLRLAGAGTSLLAQELYVVLPAAAEMGETAPAPAPEPAPPREIATVPGPPELSVVVNFYNMRREAERTLTSLSRRYQTGVEDLAYEVLCVDNGSNPPLDPDWIASFGPEFRLVRPPPNVSPCAPLNAAAAEAKGKYIAVMIDGAHVLTPGVFAEAMQHLRTEPAHVVALRQWWVGGDQRWLSEIGYSREQEDTLFDRINWPADGYKLFGVGSPIDESPSSWLAGMGESNCLFVPAEVWREIGGFDERFSTAGGGLANLDLFKRVIEVVDGRLTCLIGEASFHQYHGGTTTNVDWAEKDVRVERYQREYRAIRGERYEGLTADHFRLAGRMRTNTACITRQRPMYPASVGVTAKVRPADRHLMVDEGATTFIAGAFVELKLHEATCWGGEKVGIGPADLVHLQEVISAVRPTAIVCTSDNLPLLRFLDAMCKLNDLGATPLVVPSDRPLEGVPDRTTVIAGSPWSADTYAAIKRRIGAAEEVLVVFEGPDEPGVPIEPLRRYADLVTFGSYIVYLNTALGQPWLGYSNRWPGKAIRMLTERSERFAIDPRFDEIIGTSSPKGFIRRVGGAINLFEDDPALDHLESI